MSTWENGVTPAQQKQTAEELQREIDCLRAMTAAPSSTYGMPIALIRAIYAMGYAQGRLDEIINHEVAKI